MGNSVMSKVHSVIHFTLKVTMSQTRTVNQLTLQQLGEIAEVNPCWVFDCRPHYMACHFQDWTIRFEPRWMVTHYPEIMVARDPNWVAYNAPSVLADFDLNLLLEKNPAWAVRAIPERLAYMHPEILLEFDQAVLKTHEPSGTRLKSPSWLERLMVKIKGPYTRKFNTDPVVPQEIINQAQRHLEQQTKSIPIVLIDQLDPVQKPNMFIVQKQHTSEETVPRDKEDSDDEGTLNDVGVKPFSMIFGLSERPQ
jgi:hypothetical protein